jgi:hypothetical protein
MAITKKPAQATKKDTTAPAKKAPSAKAQAKAQPTKPVAPVKATKTTQPEPKKTQQPKPVAVMASAPTQNTAADVKARKADTPNVEAKKEAPKKPAPKPKQQADLSKMETKTKEKAQAKTTSTGKTAYHVSKRDNDGREWKVFIQGSDKVIKLFKTQAEALDYAKSLAKNKDDGSYVILHGLDGKIRRF